jgi:hypothetical protein
MSRYLNNPNETYIDACSLKLLIQKPTITDDSISSAIKKITHLQLSSTLYLFTGHVGTNS